jgi:hypothetical protein
MWHVDNKCCCNRCVIIVVFQYRMLATNAALPTCQLCKCDQWSHAHSLFVAQFMTRIGVNGAACRRRKYLHIFGGKIVCREAYTKLSGFGTTTYYRRKRDAELSVAGRYVEKRRRVAPSCRRTEAIKFLQVSSNQCPAYMCSPS